MSATATDVVRRVVAGDLHHDDYIVSWGTGRNARSVNAFVTLLARSPRARTRGQVTLAGAGSWSVDGALPCRVIRLSAAEWEAIGEWAAADAASFRQRRLAARAAREDRR